MFLLLLLFSSSVAAHPPIDCFVDQQSCEIERDNLINTYPETTSVEECKLLCEDKINFLVSRRVYQKVSVTSTHTMTQTTLISLEHVSSLPVWDFRLPLDLAKTASQVQDNAE